MGSEANFPAYKDGILLWKIISPFLIVFGTVGNILTIIVLTKKHVRRAPTSLLLSSLAMSDLLALNTGCLRQWIKYTFDIDIREDLSASGCRLHWFMVYLETQFSSWMLVCLTTERVISTILPHLRHKFCTFKIAVRTVIVILCSLAVLNAHYVFGYGDQAFSNSSEVILVRCTPLTKSYDNFILYTWTWIDFSVFYFVPMIVVVTGNSIIIYTVLDSTRRTHVGTAAVDAMTLKKISSLTVSLLLVSVSFVVCVLPIVVYPIGDPYWKKGASDRKVAELFLIETIANLLMYVNHSVNFVLYFMSGSKFRKEVKQLVCKMRTPVSESASISRSVL